MKKLLLLITMLLCLALAAPALAATIDHAPMSIESDGETATFTLTAEDLPEMLKIGMASTKQGEMEYDYTISFFDGEHAYIIGLREMKFDNSPERNTPLPWAWNALYVIGAGSVSSYAMDCAPTVDGNVITWSLTLPVVDRDGNECPMNFDSICAYGYSIFNIALDQNEQGYFQVQEDGSVEEIGIMDFYNLIG